jgi:hypothetical protein
MVSQVSLVHILRKRYIAFSHFHRLLFHSPYIPSVSLCRCFSHPIHLQVKVTLRPTVSRPVCLGVRSPSGTRDQFFFLVEIFFQTVTVCYFVAPSLMRGRVCNLLLLLVLASAVTLGPALSDKRSGLSFVSISLQSVIMYIRH